MTIQSAARATALTKSYATGFTLGPLDLAIPTGYVVGLVGPNGAGKTTLIRSLLGLAHPTSGAVEVLGRPVDAHVGGVEGVGMVADLAPYPEDWRVADIGRALALADQTLDRSRFAALCDRFGVALDKRIKELSRGMGVKVQMAAALARDCRLLLLDEPTSGLDPASRADLLDLIQDAMTVEDRSVLFSTHITNDIEKIADYTAILVGGHLHDFGPTEDVVERYRLVRGGKIPDGTVLHGLRRSSTGFEAVADVAVAESTPGLVVEPATLDDIVAALGRN